MTQLARGAEGWRPDPFSRFESRFYDGVKWTPYVKNGEEHALDEPGESLVRGVDAGPRVLQENLLVIEQHVDENARSAPYSVRDAAGLLLASIRRSLSDDRALEVFDDTGKPTLCLQILSSGRKRIVAVRDGAGADLGRIVQQHLPGVNWFALESVAGQNVGFVRARTWVGWDVRIEDERSRLVATVTKGWDGLDRSLFPAPDNFVVRISRDTQNPHRVLMMAAVLGLDTALKQDARGFD